jgi:hypothetical protein
MNEDIDVCTSWKWMLGKAESRVSLAEKKRELRTTKADVRLHHPREEATQTLAVVAVVCVGGPATATCNQGAPRKKK